jgi:hypothetical protein
MLFLRVNKVYVTAQDLEFARFSDCACFLLICRVRTDTSSICMHNPSQRCLVIAHARLVISVSSVKENTLMFWGSTKG